MWATRSWHHAARLSNDCSLEVFIRNLKPHPHETYASLQYCDILNEKLDYILRFENLHADFDHMLESAGIGAVALPHLEQRRRMPYTEMYNETEKNLVSELFASDISRFGYEF